MARALFTWSSRSLTSRLILLGGTVTFLLTVYTFLPASLVSRLSESTFFPPSDRGACPPRAWANGSWTRRAPTTSRTAMSTSADALEFAGLDGCASSREFYWHLGADHEEMWDRFPNVTSWLWTPPKACDIRPFSAEAVVRHMVEDGGWLLIGDSVTENHFFSLSCMLFPHVRATPNYTENPYFDRAWPQHLYLEPASPLVPTLRLPPGFDIAATPLVTFRRVDLLLDADELTALHRAHYGPPPAANFSLFSAEPFWSLSPAYYTALLAAPPPARYATLVVSTAGHWTTTLLSGFRDERRPGDGIEDVRAFFRVAMRAWADRVQAALDRARGPQRRVLVRAYLPGHDDCHSHREPWAEYARPAQSSYNWGSILDFNDDFEEIVAAAEYPDIHFLPVQRPALLRPDAHAAGDCLHIMTGAGVLEGWSHYIWHFVTRELPGRRR